MNRQPVSPVFEYVVGHHRHNRQAPALPRFHCRRRVTFRGEIRLRRSACGMGTRSRVGATMTRSRTKTAAHATKARKVMANLLPAAPSGVAGLLQTFLRSRKVPTYSPCAGSNPLARLGCCIRRATRRMPRALETFAKISLLCEEHGSKQGIASRALCRQRIVLQPR